jgi:hypothetical protein
MCACKLPEYYIFAGNLREPHKWYARAACGSRVMLWASLCVCMLLWNLLLIRFFWRLWVEPLRLRDPVLLFKQRNVQNRSKRRTLIHASQHKFDVPELQGGAYKEFAGWDGCFLAHPCFRDTFSNFVTGCVCDETAAAQIYIMVMWEWRHSEGNIAASENCLAFWEQDGLNDANIFIMTVSVTIDICFRFDSCCRDTDLRLRGWGVSNAKGKFAKWKLRKRSLLEYVQQGFTNFLKIWELRQHSSRQKGDMKQVSC